MAAPAPGDNRQAFANVKDAWFKKKNPKLSKEIQLQVQQVYYLKSEVDRLRRENPGSKEYNDMLKEYQDTLRILQTIQNEMNAEFNQNYIPGQKRGGTINGFKRGYKTNKF